MDSIQTFDDKIHWLRLCEFSQEEIIAHIANGTAELLADIESIDGLHYASPPHGGWVITEDDDVVAVHYDRDKAYDEADRWGGKVHFDLFAIPTHGYYPVTERPLVNGRQVTYGRL